MQSAGGLTGSPPRSRATPFPSCPLLDSDCRRPSVFRRGHPPTSRVPFEAASDPPLLPVRASFRSRGGKAPPSGFGCSLIATSAGRIHFTREGPASRYGPSSAFLPPSTVCAAPGLAGLFHPAAASRVSRPSGVCSPRGAVPDFSGRCPLAVCCEASCGCPRRSLRPAASGPCSPRRVRRPLRGVQARLGSAPLPGFPSSGCSFSASWLAPPSPVFSAANPLRSTLDVLRTAECGLPGIRPPTRSRFLA